LYLATEIFFIADSPVRISGRSVPMFEINVPDNPRALRLRCVLLVESARREIWHSSRPASVIGRQHHILRD
jgi:hypothetical protein